MNSLLMVAIGQARFQSVAQLLRVVPMCIANQWDVNIATSLRSNYFPIQVAEPSHVEL